MSVSRVSQILLSSVSHAVRKPQQFVAPAIRYYSNPTGNYEFIKIETAGEKKNVGLVTLNKPGLNALCHQLMNEIDHALNHFDSDSSIAVIVLTGSEKAFAVGADIKEIKDNSYASYMKHNFIATWNGVAQGRKLLIAAVNGYALGGGCVLAMMCDMIYAGDKAKFALSDVGTIPGGGGTQRLTRVISKRDYRINKIIESMEMMLTGNMISAEEAEKSGLLKVFPTDKLVEETVKVAEKIGTHSSLAVALAKEATNAAYETILQQEFQFERRMFRSTFSLADRKEALMAILEKRPPKYTNE